LGHGILSHLDEKGALPMARTVAGLPEGTRITDHISLGVIARTFPLEKVHAALSKTGRQSQRQRNLPAHVVVYYSIALALYMQVCCKEVLRCLLEGVSWLLGSGVTVQVTGTSGISQARVRVGSEPLEALHDELVAPIARREAEQTTPGAWYRQWRLVSIDGSTLDLADTKENDRAFGRPGASRGKSAFPQLRFVSLVENGTHVLFGTRMGGCGASEAALAREVLPALSNGMLCLADRGFYSYSAWRQARTAQAELVWRVKKNLRLPCLKRFRDGSFLSRIYASDKDRRHDKNGVTVRVVEYTLEGVPDAEPLYRLIASILEPRAAPAQELAALYHERWEIETAFDELKTHLRGAKIVLRSKRPDLVRQEFYGLLLAHFAVRGLMHEAALRAGEDPDRLSFVHAVRVIRRKLARFVSLPPSGPGSLP
jgi:hypothetical protein